MTYPDVSNLQVASGYLVLAGLFVLKEITSGALKEAGTERWVWARNSGSRRVIATAAAKAGSRWAPILQPVKIPPCTEARTPAKGANTMHPRFRHLWQLIGILAMIALVLGVGLDRTQAQEGAAVSIVDFAFDPAAVEIPVGATVTWTNTGAATHTATASDGTFDSGQLAPGASFSHTFTAAGTFPYICQIHPQMTGTVTVVEAAAAGQAEEAEQPRRERATPAADGQVAQGGGAETVQVPRTGVGTMALTQRSGGLVLLAGLAAVVLGAGAFVAYRRS